jgi:hypothetical protein
MAAIVVPGSAKITVTQYPGVDTPTVPFRGTALGGPPPGPIFAGFTCRGIGLAGEVSLRGSSADIAACTLGFIQVQWIETSWFYYRGKTTSDGSMLVQLGRPPARPQQACRDLHKESTSRIWYNNGENGKPTDVARAPVRVGTNLDDEPFETALLGQINSLTKKTNLLREAQVERHFCAILSLEDGDGVMRHQASRYWNLHWQAVFQPGEFDEPFTKPWKVSPVARGNSAAVGPTIQGSRTDPRFSKLITEESAPICNEVLKRAESMIDNLLPNGDPNPAFDPATRRESSTWTNFDVRR